MLIDNLVNTYPIACVPLARVVIGFATAFATAPVAVLPALLAALPTAPAAFVILPAAFVTTSGTTFGIAKSETISPRFRSVDDAEDVVLSSGLTSGEDSFA